MHEQHQRHSRKQEQPIEIDLPDEAFGPRLEDEDCDAEGGRDGKGGE